MDNRAIVWHYPESVEHAGELVKSGATPCAGGTFLLRKGVANVSDLVDLSRLSMGEIGIRDGTTNIGAMARFTEIIRALPDDSLLVKSLRSAASTPLRNHITIGGSVAAFPMWSNVIGPLLAMDAKIHFFGEGESPVPIEDFLADSSIAAGRLIVGISFEEKGWRNYFFSAKRAVFDYSAFNISIAADVVDGRIEDARIVVVGCKGKYRRLKEIEDAIKGKNIEEHHLADIADGIDIGFGKKAMGSPEYIRHLFNIEIERGLNELLKG